MTALQQITRSFGWLSIFGMRKAVYMEQAEHESGTGSVSYVQEAKAPQVRITGNVIKLPTRLDDRCHQEVMEAVAHVSQQASTTILDLQETVQLGTSGFFTLHCVVMMMRGETAPDPNMGWSALRSVVEANLRAGKQENVYVMNAAPEIESILRANHFDSTLVIGQPERYADKHLATRR